MADMRFGTGDVWDQCGMNNIGSDINGRIRFVSVQGVHLMLLNSAAGGAPQVRKFVLCSDTLPKTILPQGCAHCKSKQVSLCCLVSDALFYDRIFVVGNISAPQLAPLALNQIPFQQIAGTTAQTVAANLAAVL